MVLTKSAHMQRKLTDKIKVKSGYHALNFLYYRSIQLSFKKIHIRVAAAISQYNFLNVLLLNDVHFSQTVCAVFLFNYVDVYLNKMCTSIVIIDAIPNS